MYDENEDKERLIYNDPRMMAVRYEKYQRQCNHTWLFSAVLGSMAGIVIGIGIVCLMI